MNRFLLRVTVAVLALAVMCAGAYARGGHGGRFGGRHHSSGSWYPAPGVPLAVAAVPTVEAVTPDTPAPASLTCRYLQINNNTGQKLSVFLQYRTWTDRQRYRWYPGDPETSDDVLAFEVEPGAETYLDHDGWRINASRVRLWAEGENGEEWLDYKDKDLWLVEPDDNGQRSYSAHEMETFTFTFEG